MILHLLGCWFIIMHFLQSFTANSLSLSLVCSLNLVYFHSIHIYFLFLYSHPYIFSLSQSVYKIDFNRSILFMNWDHNQISSPLSDLISIDLSFGDDVTGGCCKPANDLQVKLGCVSKVCVFLFSALSGLLCFSFFMKYIIFFIY